MRALIAAVPSPIWARDEAGKLAFVNHAYARAVEAKDAAEAVGRGTELFEHGGRSGVLRAHGRAPSYFGRLAARGPGGGPSLDREDAPAPPGRAGPGGGATQGRPVRARPHP